MSQLHRLSKHSVVWDSTSLTWTPRLLHAWSHRVWLKPAKTITWLVGIKQSWGRMTWFMLWSGTAAEMGMTGWRSWRLGIIRACEGGGVLIVTIVARRLCTLYCINGLPHARYHLQTSQAMDQLCDIEWSYFDPWYVTLGGLPAGRAAGWRLQKTINQEIKVLQNWNQTAISLKPHLHDTTCCQTGCHNPLNVCIHVTTGCQAGLTTGCIVYTNIQPVVKPVWQPVWQPAVSCIQPVVKPGCTTSLTTVLNEQSVRSTQLSNRLYNAAWQPVERTAAVRSTRLNKQGLLVQHGCQTGWQPVVSCKRGIIIDMVIVHTYRPTKCL